MCLLSEKENSHIDVVELEILLNAQLLSWLENVSSQMMDLVCQDTRSSLGLAKHCYFTVTLVINTFVNFFFAFRREPGNTACVGTSALVFV